MVDVKIGEEVDMSKGWRFRVGGETRKKIAQHWVRIKDAPFGLSGTLPTEEVAESSCEPANTVIIQIITPYKMNYSTAIIVTFGIISLLLIGSSSSTAMINCEPNSLTEAPAKIRQLCYYVMEQIRSEPQDNGEMIDNKLYERGIKRQDVDHVFLRFGRRFGL